MERAFEALVLIAIAAPVARLPADAGFRGAFPRLTALLLAGILAFALAAAFAASRAPLSVVRGATVFALAGFAWTAFRARTAYGRSRGWPPGSLGFLRSVDLLTDRAAYRKRAERHGPVFKARQYLHPVVCVVGFERAHSLLRRHAGELSVAAIPIARIIPGGFLRYMTPDVHREHRPIFQETFAEEVVAACAPFFARQIRSALTELAAESRNGDRGAPPKARIETLVFDLFLRLFFGVEPESEEAGRLERLYRRLDPNRVSRRDLRESADALAEIQALVVGRVDAWERAGVESAPRCFLRALLEARPEFAREPTVVCNLIYMLKTTSGDVAGLLPWILVELSENPRWVERMRDPGTQDSLSIRIVQETLRLEQSEYLYRRVDRPIAVEGFQVPAGWLLRVCVRESHRDPAVFPRPDVFDPDRFLDRPLSTSEYSPFGATRFACLGKDVTLEVGRVFVEELTRGFDWTIVEDAPRELGGRHWGHWRPSRRLRIRMTERAAS